MASCAFVPCAEANGCAMVGGCVVRNPRFVQPTGASELKAGAKALNGQEPARTNAHPSTKHKNRKPIHRTGLKG